MDINAIEELQKQVNQYDIQVGVFDNVPRRKAVSGKKAGVSNLAGGPVRKTTLARVPSFSVDVAQDLQVKYHWLSNPFIRSHSIQTKETIAFTKYFMDVLATGKKDASTLRRVANLVQAIVRNPITRGEYGSNSPQYAKIKGFNRLLFDTGQFFKSIIAKVK